MHWVFCSRFIECQLNSRHSQDVVPDLCTCKAGQCSADAQTMHTMSCEVVCLISEPNEASGWHADSASGGTGR